LPAIWRAAAAIQATRFFRQKCGSRFTTAAQPIATKVYSHRVRRGFVEYSMVWRKSLTRLDPAGVRLAGDLARSGSNPNPAVFQIEMRQPVYDCCAADRDQGLLPQGSPQPAWSCGTAFRRQAANQAPRCVRCGLFAGMPYHGCKGGVDYHARITTCPAGFSGSAHHCPLPVAVRRRGC
jgi:hypothetical protein